MSTHALKVEAEHVDERLDVFITQVLPEAPSRSFVRKLIDGGHVSVNELRFKANYRLRANDNVIVEIPKNFLAPDYIEPEDIPLDVFYEDESLIVVNKVSGMLVHPATGRHTGTLVNALLYRNIDLSDVNTSIRPGIVHRLDEETSGLILVAKDNITHTKLAKQFQQRVIKKEYVALVERQLVSDEGVINQPLARHPRYRDKFSVRDCPEAKEAITRYRVWKRFHKATLVKLYPKTGRTHQLRVHMTHLNHPIVGDSKYGKGRSFPRLALHARAIGFKHPHTKSFLQFVSQVPNEFLSDAKVVL